MVVLAYLAYRYWRSTATYARRVREAHAERALESYRVTTEQAAARPEEPPTDPEAESAPETEGVEPPFDPAADVADEEPNPDAAESNQELRLIDELETRLASVETNKDRPVSDLLKELDAEIAALPSNVELIDLPTLERRRVANRRQALLNQRAALLQSRTSGAHRRKRRQRNNQENG